MIFGALEMEVSPPLSNAPFINDFLVMRIFLACQFYGFTQGFFGLMAIVNMAVISTERLLAIRYPFVVRSWTYRDKLMIVGGVWIYSFALASPPLFHWGKYVPVAYLTTCCFDYISRDSRTRAFVMYLFTFGFVIPIGVILFSYAQIFRLVRSQDNKMLSVRYCGSCKRGSLEFHPSVALVNHLPKPVERRSTLEIQGRLSFSNHVKTARIMLMVIGTFLLTWTPYACVALVGQFGPEDSLTPTVAMLAAIVAKTSSIYNPFIYAFKDKKFRLAAVQLLSSKFKILNVSFIRVPK